MTKEFTLHVEANGDFTEEALYNWIAFEVGAGCTLEMGNPFADEDCDAEIVSIELTS